MTKGGGGDQKSQKIDDVFYERPLALNSCINRTASAPQVVRKSVVGRRPPCAASISVMEMNLN